MTNRASESGPVHMDGGENDAFYRDFFDYAPDMFATIRTGVAEIRYCNLTMCERLGWERDQLIGANIFSIYHPDCHAEVKRLMRDFAANGEAHSDALMLLPKSGDGIPVSLNASSRRDATGRILNSRCVWRDVAQDHALERLKLNLRLQSAQKTESVALLTSSVAHDFNNLLVAMMGNADLGRRNASPESPEYAKFRDIESAARQAADLTKQLLTYSVTRHDNKATFDLSKTVAEISHLLEVAIARKAHLDYEFHDSPVNMWGDVAQIRQVIMNLLTNGADAVDPVDGRILLRTGIETVSRNALIATLLGTCLRPGEYGFLEVTDNGVGLTEEQQNRMFDPFFTTKSSGHGLGLAAVLGIVRAHAGTLSVSSQLGQGTSIKVLFPRAPRKRGHDMPADRPRKVRGEHVLLIDGEKLVRGAARRILEDEGFVVTECSNGDEAVALYDVIGDTVDVVLLDLSMPRCDGMTTYQSLRQRSDDQRVVLMSGFGAPPSDAMNDDRALRFLQKPFEGHALVDTVLDALATG